MARKLALGALISVLAAYYWLALASAAYCLLTRHWPLFEPPFLQWLDVLPYWHQSAVRFFIIASAVLASVALLLPSWVILRRLWGVQRPLFGASRWASGRDIRRAGMRIDRNPFR